MEGRIQALALLLSNSIRWQTKDGLAARASRCIISNIITPWARIGQKESPWDLCIRVGNHSPPGRDFLTLKTINIPTAHAALYLKEDGSNVMNQGRGGSDCCEHLFGKCRYINSNPTMQQARECASKVSGALGMHSRAFMVDSKGNSGTASTETTAEDLLQPLETTKKRKRTGD